MGIKIEIKPEKHR